MKLPTSLSANLPNSRDTVGAAFQSVQRPYHVHLPPPLTSVEDARPGRLPRLRPPAGHRRCRDTAAVPSRCRRSLRTDTGNYSRPAATGTVTGLRWLASTHKQIRQPSTHLHLAPSVPTFGLGYEYL